MIHTTLSPYQPVRSQTAIAEEEQNLINVKQKLFNFQKENMTSPDWL